MRLSTGIRITLWASLLLLAIVSLRWMTAMPGSSASDSLPAASELELTLAQELEADVRALAEEIGERNMHRPGTLDQAADWLEERLRAIGHEPQRQPYELSGAGMARYAGETADNLVVEIPGESRPDEIVVVGAHYDTVPGSPGANDNASAVAVLLALAEHFRDKPQARTLRFVAFVNEEPPFYMTSDMGSHAHARKSREAGDNIIAMMSMDGLGFFSDQPGSQHYPAPGIGLAYPDTASFIGFVTRLRDGRLLRKALGAFREEASIPSEGAAMPGFIPGVGWSDHWSFWQQGYPAFLVTDSLPFRDPHYHRSSDTPDRLDYERMARVTVGLKAVVRTLAE